MVKLMFLIACLLITVLSIAVAQNNVTEIGLTRLPDSGDQCPDIIQYECITSGRGSDAVALDFQEQFRASHAEYIDGVEDQRLLGGDLIIGNLSRSTGMDCVDPQTNMRDYCYTFIMTVQLTDQTLCRVITCTIAFLDGSNTDVGNATITRCNVPSAPSNLRNVSLFNSSVAFLWDPGTPTCPNTNYSVSIMNCSTCSQNISTKETNVTCDNLEPGLQLNCTVIVQSVSECENRSDSLLGTFEVSTVLSVEGTATKATTNVGAIIGSCIAVFAVIVMLIVLLVVLWFIWKRRHTFKWKRRQKSSDSKDTLKLLTLSPPTQPLTAGKDARPLPIGSLDDKTASESDPQSSMLTKESIPVDQSDDKSSVKPKVDVSDKGVDFPDNQQHTPHPQDCPSDPEVRVQTNPSRGSNTGKETAATGTEKHSLQQIQSEVNVSGTTDDQQPTLEALHPQNHQSNPDKPNDQQSSGDSRARATPAGTGKQSSQQIQSKEPRCLSGDQSNEKLETAASDTDPQSLVKPKVDGSGTTDDQQPTPEARHPQDCQSNTDVPTGQSSSSDSSAGASIGEQSSQEIQSEVGGSGTTDDQQPTPVASHLQDGQSNPDKPTEQPSSHGSSVGAEAASTASTNTEKQFFSQQIPSQESVQTDKPINDSTSGDNEQHPEINHQYGTSSEMSHPLEDLQKEDKAKASTMVAASGTGTNVPKHHLPTSSVLREQPVPDELGHPHVQTFNRSMDQEKRNDEIKQTRTSTDAKQKLGPQKIYTLGEHGKLFCEQQSSLDESSGHSLTVGGASNFSSDARSRQMEDILDRLEVTECTLEKQAKQIEKQAKEVEKHEQEIQGLKTSKEKQQEEINRLKSEITQITEELAQKQAENKDLKCQVEDMKQQLKDKGDKLKDKEEEVEDIKEQLKDKEDKLKDKEAEVEDRRTQLKEKEDKLKDKEAELQDTKQQLVDREQQLKDVKDENRRLREIVNRYQNQETIARTNEMTKESCLEEMESKCRPDK